MTHVVTDSPSGITPALAKELGVDGVIASYAIFGDETFIENETMTPHELHARMKSSPIFPTTAAPSIGDCVQVYESLKDAPILSIHLSRDLSGTIAAAEQAAKEVGGDITFVDTRNVSVGEALLVLEAVKMAKDGASPAEAKAALEALVPRVHFHIVFETLENLKRGGRIGGAQAFIGGVLQMKPILTVRHGKLEPLERVRTMSKAVARLKEIIANDAQGKPDFKFAIMHAAAPDAAKHMADELTAEFGVKPELVLEAGASVAIHSGPGAVGVAYIV